MPVTLSKLICPGLRCFAGSSVMSMLPQDADGVLKLVEALPRRRFHLNGSSVLAISQGDLAQWEGDAVVNAATEQILGGPDVGDAVIRAAGSQLAEACEEIEQAEKDVRCPTGEARTTEGFRLKAKHVINAVGPVYQGREKSEPLLRDAIKNSLLLCKANRLKSVAFPAISCGSFGYPADEAAEAAIAAVQEFSEDIDLVEFILSGQDTYGPFVADASKNLQEYRVTDVEDDAPGNELSERKIDGVLPDSAEDAGESRESRPDETKGVAPSGVTLEGEGATLDPMSQEQGDDTLDESVGATGGDIQAEYSERTGASGIDSGEQKGGHGDTEAAYGKRTIARQGVDGVLRGASDALSRDAPGPPSEGMQSDNVDTGANFAAGKKQIKRGASATGANRERDGLGRRTQKRGGAPPRRLFQLEGSSVLAISRGDLTKWEGDAIVNAANELMLGGEGVDGAIHRAAGPQLVQACWQVREVARGVRCPTGEARITKGFHLKAKYVIHTVGPVYRGRERSEPLLRNAIKNSLLLCKKHGLKSVAFPAISCGIYGYPADEAAEVAIATIREFSEGIDLIEFVLFGQDTYGPFMADASKYLQEYRVTDGEDDASGNEMSERKIDGVLPDSAEDAGHSGESRPDEMEGVAPSGVTLEGKGATLDPMSQEQGDDTLDESVGATGGGSQAENSERTGASGIDSGKQKRGHGDTEAVFGKRTIARQGVDSVLRGASDALPRGATGPASEGMQSDNVDTGANFAAGKEQIKRGASATGANRERDGLGRRTQKRGGAPPRRLFQLEGPSVLAISQGDLTKWEGDAIVNAANELMLGGAGVDGAIHRAAGPQLVEACWQVREVARGVRCPTGEARITKGFHLKAKYVIHTVGPVYEGRERSEPLLRNAIKNSLLLCKKHGLKSVAFPAISCGIYGYPADEAAEVAIATIREFSEGIDLIEFVLFGQDTYWPFLADASKNLQEYRVTDGEDDASGNEMSERKIDGVLLDSAEEESEHKSTASLPTSESKRREEDS